MASNQFGPGRTGSERSAAEIKATQDAARTDAQRQRAAAAAGRDRRSIGAKR